MGDRARVFFSFNFFLYLIFSISLTTHGHGGKSEGLFENLGEKSSQVNQDAYGLPDHGFSEYEENGHILGCSNFDLREDISGRFASSSKA